MLIHLFSSATANEKLPLVHLRSWDRMTPRWSKGSLLQSTADKFALGSHWVSTGLKWIEQIRIDSISHKSSDVLSPFSVVQFVLLMLTYAGLTDLPASLGSSTSHRCWQREPMDEAAPAAFAWAWPLVVALLKFGSSWSDRILVVDS